MPQDRIYADRSSSAENPATGNNPQNGDSTQLLNIGETFDTQGNQNEYMSAFGMDLSAYKFYKVTRIMASAFFSVGGESIYFSGFSYPPNTILTWGTVSTFGGGSKAPVPNNSWVTVDTGVPSPENLSIFGLMMFRSNTEQMPSQGGLGMGQMASHTHPNKPYIDIVYESFPPLAPTTLNPNNAQQSASVDIKLTWANNIGDTTGALIVPSDDPIIQTNIRYNINGGEWQYIVSGPNEHIFPKGTFSSYPTGTKINWQVQSVKEHNGIGPWSDVAFFTLSPAPPNAPIIIYPDKQTVRGTTGIVLEWRYSSDFDLQATKYKVAYQIGKDPVIEVETLLNNYTIPPMTIGTKVNWTVQAFGQSGDASPISNAWFFTAGTPAAPIILDVTNSNRPQIRWSAVDISTYELQVLENNIVIYETDELIFNGNFDYVLETFLNNGDYIVQMRIRNEYGFYSDWSSRAFVVNPTTKPLNPTLTAVDNPDYHVRLYFTPTAETIYIYRAPKKESKFYRIGKVSGKYFDDYEIAPKVDYIYFVRAVNSENNFSDSEMVSVHSNFIETIIAPVGEPNKKTILLYNIGGKPDKSFTELKNRSVLTFAGRSEPVTSFSKQTSKDINLSFYLKYDEYEKLKEIENMSKLLILKDWRLGVVYGTINGGLSVTPEKDGVIVSFIFTRNWSKKEVDL